MFEIDVTTQQAHELFQKKLKVNFEKMMLKLPRSVPGQWVQFKSQSMSLLGYYSNKADKEGKHYLRFCGKGHDPSAYIKEVLNDLIQLKSQYWGADHCGRLVHGESDGLPGIVIDKYTNCAIAKYEDVGFDTYRNIFASSISEKFDLPLFVQDDDEKRLNLGMPSFSEKKISFDIETIENKLHFIVEKDVVQKAGFYHDHKINRQKMLQALSSLVSKKSHGIDLFSYVGGWGMHMLAGGVGHVDFIDQGQFEGSILKTLKKNHFQSRGSFIRSDVFAFLEKAHKEQKKYQIICCDPPAFAKSKQQIESAKKGYAKLVEKICSICDENGMLFFGSCTHYIDLIELDQIIRNKMMALGFNLSLIDIGTQAPDHTNSGLSDRSNYIKYLSYKFKKG
jgi:23S rRNA (cytosine1962-C5)-methyltransferase